MSQWDISRGVTKLIIQRVVVDYVYMSALSPSTRWPGLGARFTEPSFGLEDSEKGSSTALIEESDSRTSSYEDKLSKLEACIPCDHSRDVRI